MFQIAISAAQLTVCAVHFHVAPTRNAVNIAVCAVSLPLVTAGLSALHNPEWEYAVLTMHFYQCFFLLRSALVCFDYGYLLRMRSVDGTSSRDVVIATLVLAAILTLQALNSLLVMAVVRVMRKRRKEAVAREAGGGGAACETTPLMAAHDGGKEA
jgi:hypothetical protein